MFGFLKSKSAKMAGNVQKLFLKDSYHEAIELADNLYCQYIDSEDSQERAHAKAALTWKTTSLIMLEEYQNPISVCEKIIDIYTHGNLPEDIHDGYNKKIIRAAYTDKARALYGLKEYNKSLKIIDSVVDEGIDCTDELTEVAVLEALLLKYEILQMDPNLSNRLIVLNKISFRFQLSDNPKILEQVIPVVRDMMLIFITLKDIKNLLIVRRILENISIRSKSEEVPAFLSYIDKFEESFKE
ncbi:hypothetical protein I6E84_07250 [Psychrobacter sp. SCQQ22]|uniref:hypothetical protein n=1 Tax=Psychrobacter sp. SCQQ22 TaxID=2792059 RepID=UPI0018CE3504|nr:hypothetical protein [Psychrobacter sp. SCQQ22]MBH0086012.1 hypothetical protein [Psychrobacter sp. SCQQ22]